MNKYLDKTTQKIADDVFGPDKPKIIRNDLFSKFPHWLVDNEVISIMQPKTLRVYSVLLRYADFTTGNGRVGNKRISKESGVYASSIPSCIKFLKGLSVISTWRKGWVRYYKIQYKSPANIKEIVAFFKPDKSPKNTDAYRTKDDKGRFNRPERISKPP